MCDSEQSGDMSSDIVAVYRRGGLSEAAFAPVRDAFARARNGSDQTCTYDTDLQEGYGGYHLRFATRVEGKTGSPGHRLQWQGAMFRGHRLRAGNKFKEASRAKESTARYNEELTSLRGIGPQSRRIDDARG